MSDRGTFPTPDAAGRPAGKRDTAGGPEPGPVPGVVEGQGFRYRPGELVVDAADVAMVAGRLAEVGAVRDERLDERLRPYVARYRVPAGTDVPSLVRRLREGAGGPVPRVGPNHVLTGEPVYQGGPGSSPVPAKPMAEPATTAVAAGAPVVAVLDTGIAADAQRRHPLLAHRYAGGAADVDPLDTDVPADGLDDQAGHGTFIAGLVALLAPAAGLLPIRVLSSDGLGDELTVAVGLLRAARAGAGILNLSLGGYTQDDKPPVALGAVLGRIPPTTAVVAAAGNAGSDRLFWPAAFKRVVAVAALGTGRGPLTPAPFSNSGWWVDACAPGTRIRGCFVAGRRATPGGPTVAFEGFASWDGTSFAAPQVAAAIAERSAAGVTPAMAAAELLTDPKRDRLPGYGVVVLPRTEVVCP